MVRADFLATIELFEGLDDDTLRDLALHVEHLTLPDSTLLFRQGDPSEDLFVVVRGAVRITIPADGGRERVVAVRGALTDGISPTPRATCPSRSPAFRLDRVFIRAVTWPRVGPPGARGAEKNAGYVA